MIILEKISEIKATLDSFDRSMGLVPTMGSLHEGHRSLLKLARKQNRTVVASLFVNPKQFGPSEDFERYPRNWDMDKEIFEEEGIDVLFAPTDDEIYPNGFSTYIYVGHMAEQLEGLHRPNHFKGVATVVCKLLNICKPDHAYFGQKDAQQSLIIRKFCEDLNLGTQIIIGPTIRDHDGLALSSRNIYLTPLERESALLINKSLEEAKIMWMSGGRDSTKICGLVEQILSSRANIEIDYVALVNPDTFLHSKVAHQGYLLAIAVRIGSTRLIDNLMLNHDSVVTSQIEI